MMGDDPAYHDLVSAELEVDRLEAAVTTLRQALERIAEYRIRPSLSHDLELRQIAREALAAAEEGTRDEHTWQHTTEPIRATVCPACGGLAASAAAPPNEDAVFPPARRLALFADATEHLLSYHDCDCHGYEVWTYALQAERAAAPPNEEIRE